MTDKQQTAVQWLQKEMQNKYTIASTHKCLELFDKALEMEREQIEQAWDLGRRDIDYPANGSDYFTDTYQTEQ